jgi:cytochrome c553
MINRNSVARLCGAALLFATAASLAAPSASVSDDAAVKLATHVCSNCHGPGGNSTSPTFPKLAAQQEPYLVAQIQAFKANNARGEQEAHDYMLGMATLIDDATVDALARYFSRQPPPHGVAGDPSLIAKGEQLFEKGVPERNIVACATCHGKNAEGAGIFPRLAGQHAEYIERQLHVIQDHLRKSPVMHGIIKDLKPDEMNALASFVQSK